MIGKLVIKCDFQSNAKVKPPSLGLTVDQLTKTSFVLWNVRERSSYKCRYVNM